VTPGEPLDLIDADDEPIDPNAHEHDDAVEGADLDGNPVVSLHGSEDTA
jgi:hypothetical protein